MGEKFRLPPRLAVEEVISSEKDRNHMPQEFLEHATFRMQG